MKINQLGIDLIKKWESFRSKPYYCSANTLTIGYGHTATFKRNPNAYKEGITEEQAIELLEKDLTYFVSGVKDLLKVQLTSNQFSAVVSFAYNLGLGNLKSSTLLRKINKDPRDYGEAIEVNMLEYQKREYSITDLKSALNKEREFMGEIPRQFCRWYFANSRPLKGLLLRRIEEANLYMTEVEITAPKEPELVSSPSIEKKFMTRLLTAFNVTPSRCPHCKRDIYKD